MNLRKNQKVKNLEIGNLAELKFQTKATEEGFVVSKPVNNIYKYDFIVDYEGKLNRIQVKSSNFIDNTSPKRVVVNAVSGDFYGYQRYTSKEIDYFAVLADNRWFIIPVYQVTGKQIRIYLGSKTKNGFYNKFEDRWELLK